MNYATIQTSSLVLKVTAILVFCIGVYTSLNIGSSQIFISTTLASLFAYTFAELLVLAEDLSKNIKSSKDNSELLVQFMIANNKDLKIIYDEFHKSKQSSDVDLDKYSEI